MGSLWQFLFTWKGFDVVFSVVSTISLSFFSLVLDSTDWKSLKTNVGKCRNRACDEDGTKVKISFQNCISLVL